MRLSELDERLCELDERAVVRVGRARSSSEGHLRLLQCVLSRCDAGSFIGVSWRTSGSKAEKAVSFAIVFRLTYEQSRVRGCRGTENAYSSLPIQASKLPMQASKADEWSGGALGKSQVTTDAQNPSCQAARFKSVRFQLSSNGRYDAKCAVKRAQVNSQRKTRPIKTSGLG